MCELCHKSSDFGHVCVECLDKVQDGRIDEHGVETQQMKCPRCNLPVGGKTFGGEAEQFSVELHRIWNDGSKTTLYNETTDHVKDNPYDQSKDPAKYVAWQGGVFYAKCRRLEDPAKVAKWLEENKVQS